MIGVAACGYQGVSECRTVAGDHFAFFEDKIGAVCPLLRRRQQSGIEDKLEVFAIADHFAAAIGAAPFKVHDGAFVVAAA